MGAQLLPGGARFIADLRLIETRCVDFMPAFAIIDTAMLAYEGRRFDQEGPNWAPLADTTVIRKTGLLDPILQRGEPGNTEGLKQSLTSHGTGSVFHVTPLSLTMGTRVSYAEHHQKGFKDRGGGDVPARPPWPTVGEIAPLWLLWKKILQAYLVRGIGAAGTAGAGASLSNA